MSAIDRAALIEAAAEVLDDSYSRWCDRVEVEQFVPETEHEAMAAAAIPVIARELLAPLRKLHQPHIEVHRDRAVRINGPWFCCAMVQLGAIGEGDCNHCGEGTPWPCPTVRLLDQIEADVRGER